MKKCLLLLSVLLCFSAPSYGEVKEKISFMVIPLSTEYKELLRRVKELGWREDSRTNKNVLLKGKYWAFKEECILSVHQGYCSVRSEETDKFSFLKSSLTTKYGSPDGQSQDEHWVTYEWNFLDGTLELTHFYSYWDSYLNARHQATLYLTYKQFNGSISDL